MKILLILIFQVLLFSQSIDHNKSNKTSSFFEESLQTGESLRNYISERVIFFSTNIDNYLSDSPNDEIYNNQTYIHVEQSYDKQESESIDGATKFRLRLKLPKLKEKYDLEIWNTKDSNDKTNDLRINDPKNYQGVNAGISYSDKLKEYLNFTSGVGVKINLNRFEPFAKAGISKQINTPYNWIVDLSERIYISDKNGFDSTSSFEIYRIYSEVYKFSNYNEYYWNEQQRHDNFYNSLRIYQNLTEKTYLSYVISATSNNKDTQMQVKTYQAYVSYRHYIKKWLYYDIIPKLSRERVNNFDSNYGIQINFGIFFGKK